MAPLPELLFGSSNDAESRRLGRLVKEETIRKLIPRVYTSNLADDPAAIIHRNWMIILAKLYPGALLSHRSALEFRPSPKGNIYLTYNTRKVLKWPGLTIRISDGPKPLEDDRQVYESLFASSLERSCLENLIRSRETEGEKRTLGQEIIEERLIQYLWTYGEKSLNQFRDRARAIANPLGLKPEFDKLNYLISAIFNTQLARGLKSSLAKSVAFGEPYDSYRIQLFGLLISFLSRCSFQERLEKHTDSKSYRNMAFWESYFSNFIEGTRFAVEEAEAIIYEGKVVENRSGDSHDILGTFQICGDRQEMQTLPRDEKHLIDLLKSRHSVILKGRPDKNPGVFKINANRAGNTQFVEPEFVVGTLKEGYKLMNALGDPLARALYVMFLISEVHPFDDGNGRIARIMMNAELVAGGRTKIIIPTVYRSDYLLNLRSLSRQSQPRGFVRLIDRAHAFSHWFNSKDRLAAIEQLQMSQAFKESEEASLQFPQVSISVIPEL